MDRGPALLNKQTILKNLRSRACMKNVSRLTRRFARSESGISAVEMAIIAPVLMILLLGIFDYSAAIFSKIELASSVRSGVQYALINSTNMAAIQTTVINSTSLDPANLVVDLPYKTCECSNGTSDPTCLVVCPVSTLRHYVVINANYTYVPIFLPTNIVLNETSTIRIQ